VANVPVRLVVGVGLVVLAGVGVIVAGATGGGSSPNPSSSSAVRTNTGSGLAPGSGGVLGAPPGSQPSNVPPCHYPKERDLPSWTPDSLPLPSGTYAYRDLPRRAGFNSALFVVKQSLQAFTRFILREWPDAGWILGRGESEPGEVETQFSKPPAFGAIKAQAVYCDPGYSVVYLVYTAHYKPPAVATVAPSPSATAS
jgi:hypothetical protein